jgi:hypothetical protein
MCASSPPGGRYCSDTRTMVRPPATGSKRSEPADLTLEPFVCHAISSLAVSLMNSASHSNVAPMGPLTTQCDAYPIAPSRIQGWA